ncbi:hypothetical protein KIPB_010833, partial [Kipferlia bialata]
IAGTGDWAFLSMQPKDGDYGTLNILVYRRDAGVYTYHSTIPFPTAYDCATKDWGARSAYLSASGSTLAVASPSAHCSDTWLYTGSVYLYRYTQDTDTWDMAAEIGAPGSNYSGPTYPKYASSVVMVSETVVAIGASDTDTDTDNGMVELYDCSDALSVDSPVVDPMDK